MTTTVMVPITPYRLQLIFSGKKTAYVTAIKPKQCVDNVLLYETKPTAGVVGAARVKIQAYGSPRQIWEYYGQAIGESHEEYEVRWGDKDSVGVLELMDVSPFFRPHRVTEFGLDRPPHGITYVPSQAEGIGDLTLRRSAIG